MNETPRVNRLKNAVDSVAVPDGLMARVRNQIQAGQPAPDANERLKRAVHSVEVPPFLEARIRNHIRTVKPSRRWLPRLVPVTIAAATVFGLVMAYQLGHLRLTVRSQESYIGTVSTQIATLMRVGLGDFIHCSVFSGRRIVQYGRYAASAGPGGNSNVPVKRATLSNGRI